MNRRAFCRMSTLAVASGAGCIARPIPVRDPWASAIPVGTSDTLVNDVHSQLNATRVHTIVQPRSSDEVQAAIQLARDTGRKVCVAGGRHAMGGQQFREGGVLIDSRRLDQVLDFDQQKGLVTVQGGIQWPALLAHLAQEQDERAQTWGIVQKQTGADRLSVAGALACNAHGRGLALRPIMDQVERIELVGADGLTVTASRTERPELFSLAIGGYGLFGVITSVQLRLRRRVKVRRVVALEDTASIIDRFEQRIRAGYLYGDFQFATDATRDSFLRRGVFSTYEPVRDDTPLTVNPTRFNPEDWARLTFYSHRYKRKAFEVYSTRYLATSGQIYWSDSQLSAAYVDDYHADIDRALKTRAKASEMITELYVPRERLAAFMEDARVAIQQRKANVVYGTVRMIERDEESYLAWATQRFACIVLNLHIEHTPGGLEAGADALRALIDVAITHGGSYYLTYHRWARRDQVVQCHPKMPAFLALKRRYDPDEVFDSEWYRHYAALFGTGTAAPS
jgi:FAD/FMN-containing dehydrogenase